MNFLPLAGFYWKHGTQIETMFAKGSSDPSLFIDVATALEPIIKKHWPALNASGLLDDALSTLKEMLAPPQTPTPDM